MHDRHIYTRNPDITIGGKDHPYLERWWIIPRNRVFNIYLHQFWRSDDDQRQFAQLIGYSHSGYGGLDYADDATYEIAKEGEDTPMEQAQRRIDFLENELHNLREALAEPMARLFGKHPDDLKEPT